MANPVRSRCAVYTRKSSEEGLEQEFNSLDAQREACEAYITSQKHEGWIIVPTLYDDGGISGGTMDRPALKKLLTDIQNNKVDVVVVYKVDRLTRSLADFTRYLDLKSVALLKEELDTSGIVSKRRIGKNKEQRGGLPIARGALYAMLRNPLYIGQINHKGTHHEGQHDPIIDREDWDQVQQTLEENRTTEKSGARSKSVSLLAGLVFDEQGERLCATHANRKGTRYRYYVSHNLIRNEQTHQGRRIPAADLEALVEKRLLEFLANDGAVLDAVSPIVAQVAERQHVIMQSKVLAAGWSRLPVPRRRMILQALIEGVVVKEETTDILIRPTALLTVCDPDFDPTKYQVEKGQTGTITLSVNARLKRVGMEMKLIVNGSTVTDRKPDPALLRLLGQSNHYRRLLLENEGATLTALARDEGVTITHFTNVLKLAFLSPEITRRILAGEQPVDLSAKTLNTLHRLPVDWAEQKSLLRFS